MFKQKKVSFKKYKTLTIICTLSFMAGVYATEKIAPEQKLNNDIIGIICSKYQEIENLDSYQERLEKLRNQAFNFPDADKVKNLAEVSMREIDVIKGHKEFNFLCFFKLQEIKENWLNFYHENGANYFNIIEIRSPNTSEFCDSGDHRADIEYLRTATGFDFYEKLTQKWKDVREIRQYYWGAYGPKK